MSEMIEFSVGKAWPLEPIAGGSDGMRIDLFFGGEAPKMILGMSYGDPRTHEVEAFDGPLRLAVAPAKPLTWVALDAAQPNRPPPLSGAGTRTSAS